MGWELGGRGTEENEGEAQDFLSLQPEHTIIALWDLPVGFVLFEERIPTPGREKAYRLYLANTKVPTLLYMLFL